MADVTLHEANTLVAGRGEASLEPDVHTARVSPSLAGIEPTTFGLEVQRAILCATGTLHKALRRRFKLNEHKQPTS
ncbi:hypothetical protein TcasGA2_TC007881 [Tribolium castaneum]|uniref:Uncharacterized protein n=1 Tax=Tribolium castaneum TaxID=7070 RepID=D2A2M3_TRICA|nr:hypothetical protein TcasGA2_TC007881 [Tribolium castaneum]